MKNLLLIFAALFFCSSSLFGQAQVALASDDGTNRIQGTPFEIEIISIKAVGTDDCGSQMQFNGTVYLNLGNNNGSMTYHFNSPKPTNYLTFDKKTSISNGGNLYSNVEVTFKVFDKDSPACKSYQDIVDINSQSNDNTLKVRIEAKKVWLLSPQNQKIRILGNVGQVITMRGNRYVNNNANTPTSNRSRRATTNTRRGNRNSYKPPTNNIGAPDVEVAEIKFVVKNGNNDIRSNHTIPHQNLPSKAIRK